MPKRGTNSTVLGLYGVHGRILENIPLPGPWMSHHVVNRQMLAFVLLSPSGAPVSLAWHLANWLSHLLRPQFPIARLKLPDQPVSSKYAKALLLQHYCIHPQIVSFNQRWCKQEGAANVACCTKK